jgi:hypothetical protein
MSAPQGQIAKVVQIFVAGATGVTVEGIGEIQRQIAGDQALSLRFTEPAGHA